MEKKYFDKFLKICITGVIAIFIVFTLRLYQLQIVKGKNYRTTSLSNRVKVVRLPAPRGIIYDRNGFPIVKNKHYFSVSFLPLSEDIDISGLADLLNIDFEPLASKIQKSAGNLFQPIPLKEGLSFKDVAVIEARRSDFPGLIIETNITRQYVHEHIGAHILGYLGKPNENQIKLEDITPETFVGQTGIEALYDGVVRGTPGKKIVEVDALGRQLKVLRYIPPNKGNDLTLTIDIALQKIAEESFQGKTGSLVAISPENGEILALVSLPSFNPNDFILGIDTDTWNRLNKDKEYPLLNRALQGAYPPGSIFKTLVAVAGFEEGVITPEFNVYCDGEMRLGSHSFGCWKSHGPVSFKKSIVESCDLYYYEVGRKLGINKIKKYAELFGLGKKSGLGISRERQGVIPSTQWKRKIMDKPWFLGETVIAAIGQGYVSMTPMQAAIMTTILSNGGYYYRPTLLKDNVDNKKGTKIPVSSESFIKIQDAMHGVVNGPGGTARSIRSRITEISGKTGTAQVIRGRIKSELQKKKFRDHAWFISYAPAQDPKIAVSVFVEHGGHGGSAAAPIAKKVIESYIGKHADHHGASIN